ncbi:MAG: AraC family transcriptional regulator [Christensenellales bacterium]|jgi:AraC-like DNA-binding protein
MKKDKRKVACEECSSRQQSLPILLYAYTSENQPQDYFFHKHDDFCEIIYIEEGKGVFFIDGERYEVSDGDLVVYNRGVVHAEFYEADVLVKKYAVCVNNILLDGLEKDKLIPEMITPVIYHQEQSAFMGALMKQIVEEVKREEPKGMQVIQGMLVSLFALIHRNAIDKEDNEETGSANTRNLVRDIKEYMEKNFMSDITLTDLANHFYISTYYLSHIVKKEMGYSPMQYIMNLRMGKAQHLLMTTDASVVSTAQTAGYENFSYFTQLFKRHTGMTPNEFRKVSGMLRTRCSDCLEKTAGKA